MRMYADPEFGPILRESVIVTASRIRDGREYDPRVGTQCFRRLPLTPSWFRTTARQFGSGSVLQQYRYE